MIPIIILYLHIVGLTAAFTSEYKKEGVGAGFITVVFLVLIFSVGWSISSFILRYSMDDSGFGMWLDRDALSLVVLSMGEGMFYYFYFMGRAKERGQR